MIFRLFLVIFLATILFGGTFLLTQDLFLYWKYAAFTLTMGIFSAILGVMRSYVVTCPDPNKYFKL